MNGPLFLLYCIAIMRPLLCGASASNLTKSTETVPESSDGISKPSPSHPTKLNFAINMSSTPVPKVTQDSISHSSPRSPGQQHLITSTTTTTTTTTTTNTAIDKFYKRECLPVFMMAGGLIIACTILLISTLLLICKVCRMSSHIKMLSNDADLISTSEYWMGTAKKSKSAPETNPKETTVLLAEIRQPQGDVGNGADKEEAAKANEDGQTGEEDKKEVGDTAKSGEASPSPVVGNASSSKPQEEATDSQAVKAGEAPSSKGIEEPKEKV